MSKFKQIRLDVDEIAIYVGLTLIAYSIGGLPAAGIALVVGGIISTVASVGDYHPDP